MAGNRDELRALLIGFNIDSTLEVEAAAELFKHTGFDAIAIMKRLRAKMPVPATLKKDLTEICILIKLRGTKMLSPSGSSKDKWSSKTSEQGKARLLELTQKYGLSSRPSPETITLSQIAATVPNITAQVLATYDFGSQVPLGELKPYYAFPHAPAIIPSDDDGQIAAWKEWAHQFDRLINAKKQGHISRVDEFFPIIHNSTIFSQDVRHKLAQHCETILSERNH